MALFWILWGIDAVITLVFVVFYFIGLSDGTVSSENGGLWSLILAGLGTLMLGTYWLQMNQYGILAKILLIIPAVPGFLYGLFLLLVVILKPRWN
ncbi:osmoprotectant transporter permease [Spirosoma sp.]|uniref:osmoprotectant transporter permease n=1 Tax=Spirosoma sp. TaxID=1899569 RepID=UPI003B3B9B02